MHLLVDYKTSDVAAFRSDFDADSEKRMQAGLTLLQMWQEADSAGTVVCLFDVNDRAKAETWLTTETRTGAQASGRFLKTV